MDLLQHILIVFGGSLIVGTLTPCVVFILKGDGDVILDVFKEVFKKGNLDSKMFFMLLILGFILFFTGIFI